MRSRFLVVLMAALDLMACDFHKEEELPLQEQIMATKAEFAPDKRIALFNITATKNTDKYILKGESNLPDALAALKEKLNGEGIDFIDSIQLLPSLELEEKTHGLVTVSVANLRSRPKHSGELATQATLGTPIRVYKKEGDWYLVQTPDKYLAWVDAGGIALLDHERADRWKKAVKIIYTKTYGHSYKGEAEKQIVSDLVAGDILEVQNVVDKYFIVKYPDGRQAYVRTEEAENYDMWLANLNPTADNLVATSKTLMGVPYLWGGTSTKGMDCSGFTKTIYFLNGMVIPRDASQQVHTGKPIDSTGNFEHLEKGDLLFFGTKATDSTKEKVVHVGMWIGGNEFIHSSEMVRVSSMDPDAKNFDEWNRNRYLRTKRILKVQDEQLLNLLKTPVFTN